jgi:hypothetical protein
MAITPDRKQIAETINRKSKERMNDPEASEFCVMCGEDVPEYRIGTNIDLRKGYVECVGQFCKKCAGTAHANHE